VPLAQVVGWMSAAPARLAGLPGKGAIAVGRDADLVAFAPDEAFTVGRLEHRNPVTPYAGRELTGVVRRTWLRGQEADGSPLGRLLDRGDR
jgi:allantoinase